MKPKASTASESGQDEQGRGGDGRSTGPGEQVEDPAHAHHRPALFDGYGGGADAPLGGYAALIAIFNAVFAAFLLVVRSSDRRIPPRMTLGDLLLLAVATHKLSRLLTKDFVTSPLRAPFTQIAGNAGAGEVNEKGRGSGLRLAIGQLVTCPWCFDWWAASFLGYGLVLFPRATRLVAATLTAVTVADYLQLGYEKAKAASGQSAS